MTQKRSTDKGPAGRKGRVRALTTWRQPSTDKAPSEPVKAVEKTTDKPVETHSKPKASKASRSATRARAPGVGNENFWHLHKRVCGDAIRRLYRMPLSSTMIVLVLGIALSLPSTLFLALDNIGSLAGGQSVSARITLYLKQDVNDSQGMQLRKELLKDAGVADASYISSTRALQQFEQQSGLGDAVRLLDKNPLPGAVVVTPRNTGSLATNNLRIRLERLGQVDSVRLDQTWLERLNAMLALGDRILKALTLLVSIAVFLAIGNTIRMLVADRRDEIRVLRLVGGSDGYIMMPFLYTGFWYGLLGGVAAWVVTGVLFLMLSGLVANLAGLYGSGYRLSFLGLSGTLALVIAGMVLGVAGAGLSSWRQLRAIDA